MIIFTCPKCGHDLINYMLTSDPPLEKKECLNCGWSKYVYQRENIRIPFYEMREATLEELKNPFVRNSFENESCRNCSSNPKNGGSGICFCVLGQQTIY